MRPMFKRFRSLWGLMMRDGSIREEALHMRSLAIKAIGWMLIVEFLYVLRMVPLYFLTNELVSDDPNWQRLSVMACTAAAVFIIADRLNASMMYARSCLNWRQWTVWWAYGHRQELIQSWRWHVDNGPGMKESKVAKNIEKFESLIDQLIFQTTPMTLRIIFVWIGVWIVGWEFGLIVLATLLFYAASLLKTERLLGEEHETQREELRVIERLGTQLTNQWRTIKELGIESTMSDQNQSELNRYYMTEAGRQWKLTRRYGMQSHVLSLSRVGVYLMVALMVARNQSINLGAVVLMISWLEQLYGNLWRFVDLQMYWARGGVALKELVDLIQLKPTVVQSADPVDPRHLAPAISVRGASYDYVTDDETKRALQDISLEIEPYSTVAFVGKSGSGKSTLAMLLQRQDDVSHGSISVGGVNLRDIDQYAYRRNYMSAVGQKVQLFDGTIAGNIRISKPDATDEQVLKAAQLAHVDEFAMELPLGYNAPIGDDGVQLSGGQQQRIAIARALLRQPKLLVMDEATSALDAETQAQIQQNIDRLIESRSTTLVIIAHRFSTIEKADVVVVMDKGQIVEVGTHEQLKRKNGFYSRLRAMESNGLLD